MVHHLLHPAPVAVMTTSYKITLRSSILQQYNIKYFIGGGSALKLNPLYLKRQVPEGHPELGTKMGTDHMPSNRHCWS